jgi:hypothetical protein
MNLPEWDTLETVEAIHSFVERWALGFFAGVVICDLLLHFLEESKKMVWAVGWPEHTLKINVRQRMWTAKWPAYSDTISLKRLLKKISWLGFATAILLEIIALPYSERIDDLSKQELTNSQKQAAASFQKSVEANEYAGIANVSAGKANERASKDEKEAARLEKEAEGERLARVKLEALIQPRDLRDPSTLTDACRPFHGHKVQVMTYLMDSEAWWLAQQIIMALGNGGIITIDRTSSIEVIGGAGLLGININGPSSETQLMNAIGKALDASNLIPHNPPRWTSVPVSSPDFVTILVGIKPLPEITDEAKPGQQQKANNSQQKIK